MTLPDAKKVFAHLMEVSQKRELRPLEKRQLIRARQVIRQAKKNPKKPFQGRSKFRTDLVLSGGKWYIYDFAFGEVKKGPFTSLTEAKKAFAIFKSRRRYTMSPRHHATLGFKTKYPGGQKSHNPKHVCIYSAITRIEGTKGKNSKYPGEKFFHNFKRPFPSMFGLPNGDLLIKRG